MPRYALSFLLFFLGCSLASNAQNLVLEQAASNIVVSAQTGKPKFVQIDPSVNIYLRAEGKHAEDWLIEALQLAEGTTLELLDVQAGKNGLEHRTYRQHIHGVPVEPGILKMHFRDSKLYCFNGDYTTEAPATAFALSESKALSLAEGYMGARVYRHNVDAQMPVQGEQLYLVSDQSTVEPVWVFTLYAYEPHDRQDVYVHASTGALAGMAKRMYNASANGTAQTKYSGTQSIVTDSLAVDSFRLVDTTRGGGVETYNMQNGLFQFNAVDFWDQDNVWNNVNAQQDEVATDAHWAAEMFYDYFFNVHGRNSYDDAGSPLITYVHYFTNYTNAFWDGTSVSVGDGDGTNYGPLTTVDIVAHEFSHGIVETTSNFTFSYEPGALTESYSDIFGTLVEFYAKPASANWTIQEDASLANPQVPTRSLADPNAYNQPDTYQGVNWEFGSADNGGVHTNGGVQNFWFYLLVNGGAGTNDNSDFYNVSGIGMNAAAAIAYYALTTYHTSTSTYADARTYTIQAATDLYGACSQQTTAVTEAWYAVGVGMGANPTIADFVADQTFSCAIPTTVQFTDSSENAVSWFWDFGDGAVDSVQNPTHQYDSAGVYTVTLIATGIGCAGGPDTLVQSNLITITNSGGPQAPSCTPATQNPGFGNFGIYNVTLGTINNSTAGGVEDYQDYSCTSSATLVAGDPMSLSVEVSPAAGPFSGEDLRVWIDYNNDGSFNNANELVWSLDQVSGVQTTVFNVPTNATQFTPLRMRVMSDFFQNNITNSCTQPQFGQAEDYTVLIDTASGPPIANFVGDNVNNILLSSTVSYTDFTSGNPTSWQWSFPGGVPASSTAQNPSVQYNTAGSYDVTLVACNALGCDSITFVNYVTVVNEVLMCSFTNTTATSGTFHDSGGPNGQYGNNENCFFLIEPPCASSVTLNFTNIDFPSSQDRVRIYDGTSDSDPLLDVIGGPNFPNPGPITANSGTMYITFISDFVGTYNGWTANWTSVIPSTPVVAAFTPNTNVPAVNTPVQFTDASQNNASSWFWDFGDGTTSTDQNPLHIYNTVDTFEVILIADNCISQDTAYTTIISTPPGTINLTPDSIYASTTSCTTPTVVPITVWNSGNGSLGVGVDDGIAQQCVNLVVTVNMQAFAGEHSWALNNSQGVTILSEQGANVGNGNTWIDSVCVNPGQYVFQAFDTFGDGWNGGTYQIEGCGSILANNGGAVPAGNQTTEIFTVSYCQTSVNWLSFSPDTLTLLAGDSAVVNVTLDPTVLSTGTYNHSVAFNSADSANPYILVPVTFDVVHEPIIGLADTCVHFDTVGVGNSPSMTIGISNPGCEDYTVNNLVFSDPAFSSAFTSFAMPVSGFVNLPLQFSPSVVGPYSASLTLQTTAGDTTICLTGTGWDAPAVAFGVAVLDSCAGLVQFTDSSTMNPTSWLWDFGDGNTSTLQNPQHTYTTNGTFTVTLTVTNAVGSNSAQQSVSSSLPDATFTQGGTPVVGDTVTFAHTGAGGTAFDWNFGDGNTGTGANTTHIYGTAGMFTVQLIASNAAGCADTSTQLVSVASPAPPVAGFTTSIADTCSGTVAFTDASSNFPSQWLWDFGDGTTDTTQNPTHTYANAGTYTVTLLVTNASGVDTSTTQLSIFVVNAGIAVSGQQFVGGNVLFTDAGSGADTWSWTFGDAGSGAGNPVMHIYGMQGTYAVNLTASNSVGCVDSASTSVTISAGPPQSNFTWSYIDSCGGSFQFTDLSLYDPDVWMWNFGDGSPSVPLQNPTHTYAGPGTYVVSLIVSNQTGADTLMQTIVVETLDAGFAITGNAIIGEQLTFTSTDGGASQWFWTFGDATIGFNEIEPHTYQDTGLFTVTLVTTNSLGCNDTATQVVHIQALNPVADFSYSITSTCNGTVDFSDASQGTSGWSWDFGDGNASNAQNPTHTYGNSGTYTVTLIATNSVGNDTTSQTVSITVDSLLAAFTWSGDTTQGGSISFINTSVGANSLMWGFDNGQTSNVTNPVVTFADTGAFNVCLVASNSCTSDTACVQITIAGGTGIGEPTRRLTANLYPNPTRNRLVVEADVRSDATFYVYDAVGQLQLVQRADEHRTVLNLGHLASGLYMVKLQSAKAIGTWPIVLED